MRIVNCEQRSPEWYTARLGIPTASAMGKLITPAGKPRKGATRDAYLLALLAERLTRTPSHVSESAAMARGRELEPFARRYYEEHTGRIVKPVGFASDDFGRYGCSPDGVCFDNSIGIEIKCPMLPAFMAYAATGEVPDDYYVQMQASMMIFGFMAWDFVVYTDVRGLNPIIKRVDADIPFQEALMAVIVAACDEVDAKERMMREDGHGVPVNTPIDLSAIERELTEQEIADIDVSIHAPRAGRDEVASGRA